MDAFTNLCLCGSARELTAWLAWAQNGKDKEALTLEEREERYRQARARIFQSEGEGGGAAPGTDGNVVTPEALTPGTGSSKATPNTSRPQTPSEERAEGDTRRSEKGICGDRRSVVRSLWIGREGRFWWAVSVRAIYIFAMRFMCMPLLHSWQGIYLFDRLCRLALVC
jgi:hypothetical protein